MLSLDQLEGSIFITLKYNAVSTSALLKDPPGCPDWAAETIRTMSLLTWDEILFSSSIFAILRVVNFPIFKISNFPLKKKMQTA